MDILSKPNFDQTEKSSAMLIKTDTFDIIFLYLSKQFDEAHLLSVLENWLESKMPTVVMGDVNWYWNGNGKNSMRAYMKSRKCNQLISKATHEDGNIIDHIYASDHFPQDSLRVNQQSVTFSDHDVISVSISPLQ